MSRTPSSSSPEPLVLAADDAPALEAVGVRVRVLVTAEASGGAFSLFEYTAPPGFAGPPPHWHKGMSELFYPLEGALLVTLDGERHALAPGDRALVPPGVVHGFSNPSPEPCRFLVHVAPGGFERYFYELGALIREAPSWPLPDMSPVAALGARFDTFPPPAARDA